MSTADARHTAAPDGTPGLSPDPSVTEELSDRDLEAVAAGTSTQCQRDQTGSSINVKRS